MDSKLTLKLDAEVIRKAKLYARKHKTSISRMVESYLRGLESLKEEEVKAHPLVDRLTGIIALPEDFDYKQDRSDYLERKHS